MRYLSRLSSGIFKIGHPPGGSASKSIIRFIIYSGVFLALLSSAIFIDKLGLQFINALALFGDYKKFSNLSYSQTSAKQKLDLYIPADLATPNRKKHKSVTTVIFYYGGCWGACSQLTKDDYRFIAQTLTQLGYICVIGDYQKYPAAKFARIINDASLIVEWVNSNIHKYGGNKNSIFLMGHSAGAHLASMLTFDKSYLKKETYQNIKGFIGLAGAYDFLPFDEPYQPALFAPPEKYYKSQTINFVQGNEPASLLLYGENDRRVKRRNIVSLNKKNK